jgi:hypothetical protein
MTLRDDVGLYFEMFHGRCGICGTDTNFRSAEHLPIALAIDHFHMRGDVDHRLAAQHGRIRGVLCTTCNWNVDALDIETNEKYWQVIFKDKYYKKARFLFVLWGLFCGAVSPHLVKWHENKGSFKAPPRPFRDFSTKNSAVTMSFII